MKIIFLLLFLLPLMFQHNTLATNQLSKDTVVVDEKGLQKVYLTNRPTFLEEYGTIIGSLLAALIAYGSIKLTLYHQIKNNKVQAKKNYRGFLISINSLLLSHQQIIEGLRIELSKMLEDFREQNRLAYDKPFTFLPIDLIKKLYFNIISYENYNIEIVYDLTKYVTTIDNLYNDLNFIPLRNLNKEIKNENEYKKRVEFYFQQLFGRIGLLEGLLDKLIKEIEIDINELFGIMAEVLNKINDESLIE